VCFTEFEEEIKGMGSVIKFLSLLMVVLANIVNTTEVVKEYGKFYCK
jgi:Na+-transporting methylmalonyl-CoA/oxaloacetate decarboxylase gamma subunit